MLVGLLPLAVLSFGILLHNAKTQKAHVIEIAQNATRAVAQSVDAEFSKVISSLEALAASPRLADDDFAAFYAETRELLARRPGWLSILLTTADARQVMNTEVPFGAPLPRVVDPDSVAATVAGKSPTVGNLRFGDEVYAFAVRVPIIRGGRVAYTLTAVLQPDAIQPVLEAQRFPSPGVAAVFDAGGTIVARTLHLDELLGKPASPELLSLLRQAPREGWAVTHTLEGNAVYSIYRRTDLGAWWAAVGIPVEAVDGSVHRAYLFLALALGLSILLGLVAALAAGRMITSPMHVLEVAARDVGAGRRPQLPETSLPSVRQVGIALADAFETREAALLRERDARRAEEEARLVAESVNAAKDEFLAMLGHELRNPLAAVANAAHLLARGDAAKAGDYLKIITRQVGQLNRLTDDLLDAGRVMMGKITLQRAPTDLGAVVASVVDAFETTKGFAGLRLTKAVAPVWVAGDAARLEQVVLNLLSNAAKYTPPPGEIGVSLREVDGQAELRVRDSGIGLDPALKAKVFDLFVQGERSLERSQGGLGIGLTLVRRLVEMHGGTVEVRSEGEGRGSEFIVRIPAVAAPAMQAAAARVAAVRPMKIGIVEDNADIRETLRMVLELEGHAVVEAADGDAALPLAAAERPDVMLVDIGLPGLDGFGVAAAIRADLDYRVRLVAMSGYGDQATKRRAQAAGFDAYLVKPVNIHQLLGVLVAPGDGLSAS